MMRPAPPRERVLTMRAALFGAAAAASLWSGAARADDPICDYDVTVLDRAAARVEIKAVCDPALQVQKFTVLSDRRHWSMDPETYRDGRGDFTYELGAFATGEGDMGSAIPYGAGVLVTPAFLLPLPETDSAAMLRFRVTFAEGGAIHTALKADADGRYSVPLLRINEVGPLLLGTVATTRLDGDPEMTLALPEGETGLPSETLTAWVSAVAESNRRFWGRSPARGGLVIEIALGRAPADQHGHH